MFTPFSVGQSDRWDPNSPRRSSFNGATSPSSDGSREATPSGTVWQSALRSVEIPGSEISSAFIAKGILTRGVSSCSALSFSLLLKFCRENGYHFAGQLYVKMMQKCQAPKYLVLSDRVVFRDIRLSATPPWCLCVAPESWNSCVLHDIVCLVLYFLYLACTCSTN